METLLKICLQARASYSHISEQGRTTEPKFARLYPEKRRPVESAQLISVLGIKSAKVREVQQLVEGLEGKIVLGQDIRNLLTRLFRHDKAPSESAEVERVLNTVIAERGSVQFGTSDAGEFSYLGLTSREMLSSVNKFPEVLIMDATHKTNQNNYPLLNVLVVHSNGHGRRAFHAFLHLRTLQLFRLACHFFPTHFHLVLLKPSLLTRIWQKSVLSGKPFLLLKPASALSTLLVQ